MAPLPAVQYYRPPWLTSTFPHLTQLAQTQTRRTTRRSVAAGSGIENDLAAKGTAPSLSTAAGKQGLKPVVTTRAAASKSVVVGKVSSLVLFSEALGM